MNAVLSLIKFRYLSLLKYSFIINNKILPIVN
jgi:hypothetical protein